MTRCPACGAVLSFVPSRDRPCTRCGAMESVASADPVMEMATQRRIASAIENCAQALIAIGEAITRRAP
jgi:hypothetical protein